MCRDIAMKGQQNGTKPFSILINIHLRNCFCDITYWLQMVWDIIMNK